MLNMNIRLIILLISFIFPSFLYAEVPPYIKKDTLENICKKVTCHPDLNKAYLGYYTKQFHKAFAVYTYKSAGKNYLSYAAWTYQYPNSYEAEKNAIKNCNKSGLDCEILFRNNSIPNEDLYNRLTQSSNTEASSSKTIIPKNAYATGFGNQGWKCNSGFTQNGNKCISKNNTNKTPANAYKTSSGWKCNTGFFRLETSDYCYKLPDNSYALSPTGFNCNSGYKKSDSDYYCIKSKSNIAVTSNKNSSSSTSSTNYNSDEANDKYVADTMEGKTGLGKILKWAGLLKDNKSKPKSSYQKKKIVIPSNAYAYQNSWKCYDGYKKSGNSCTKIVYVPSNAYAYGNSFKCYDGYKKNGNTCKKLTWKDGDYWDQEVRPGVSRLSAFGMLLSDMGNNNRGNSGFFKNSLMNSSPGLNSSTGFGYRYGDQMYDSNNNFMGYIKNGVTYDKSMRQTGTIRNNNLYNNTGNYIGPLGQDYKPGSVDFFD